MKKNNLLKLCGIGCLMAVTQLALANHTSSVEPVGNSSDVEKSASSKCSAHKCSAHKCSAHKCCAKKSSHKCSAAKKAAHHKCSASKTKASEVEEVKQ